LGSGSVVKKGGYTGKVNRHSMQSRLEQLEKDYGIEWREYSLEALFGRSTRGRRLKSADRIAGNLPFVTAGETDTGISDWIGNKVRIFSKNTITIDMFGSAKYRGYEYGADDHVAVVHTEKLSPQAALFVTTAIHKSSHAGQFDYSRNFYATDADKLTIQLPTISQNGVSLIAFDFIETFIATLNAERLATLNAYLKLTNLQDYTLTDDEQTALDALDTVTWGEFSIVSLFSVRNTHCILSRDIRPNSGDVPYLTAGQMNNAVGTFINFDKNHIDEGNCIFIGGKTFIVTYQEKNFYSNDSHNLALYYKDNKKRTKNNQLFVVTTIYKSLSPLYSWGDSVSNKKIQKDKIVLPLLSDMTPDYDYMERVIAAMQKVVIKKVVDYLDERIAKTSELVR
jgi:hypothetical protein